MDIGRDNIIDKQLLKELEESYLNYSMSVIMSRALPDARDGLKPVHRRILYTMSELGCFWNRPYKKSARVVGDVLGKYHPHGDSSIYDAMVRMAQDFSMRHELIQGQGNFGSVDGDRAAAMRYTESRMSKIGSELLRDIDKETVEWINNFDETLKELEAIVESMDDGSLKLEETIESYEKGIKLIKQAQASLKNFEKKVQILNSKNELEDFNEPE
jgi:DNA gyrase subunit A